MKIIKTLPLLTVVLVSSVVSAFGQTTDRDVYLGLYNKGDYEGALKVLRRVNKNDTTDVDALHYLGMCYVSLDRPKEGIKPLERAVALKPSDAAVRTSLAFAYMMMNDGRAIDAAREAVKIDPKIATTHYVLGVMAMRAGAYVDAFDSATMAIQIDPQFTMAYWLRSQAGLGKYSLAIPNETRAVRAEIMKFAEIDMEKFVARSGGRSDLAQYQEQLAAMKFFSEWYARPKTDDPAKAGDTGKVPLKVLSKEPGSYTKEAAMAGVSGVTRVLVAFGADGTIKHVLVIKPLGFGLDEQSVNAAKKIKFEPETRDGKPVDTVKLLEYTYEMR